MSLDKKKILSELGSVMNQLQSADCGCMGKLFSNPNQCGQGNTMGSPLPSCGGCRRAWCQGHGCGNGIPNAGESHPGIMNRTSMSHCNPPKLYSDTYSYLKSNLMQPVVQEVYDDLRSITPANTVMNNPMANKIGLAENVVGMNMAKHSSQCGEYMSNLPNTNALSMHSNQQPISSMGGGMGPEITKMFLGDGGPKQGNQQMQEQGNQLPTSMIIDAPQSPHGQLGVTPFNPIAGQMYANMNQNPVTPLKTSPNSVGPVQTNTTQENIQQNSGHMLSGNVGNTRLQPMAAPNQRAYGQHAQGVMKFNEMFPGITQGGDLGFDPMAIAIQMNPANQQRAAMGSMQKFMNGTLKDKFSAQPAVSTATANMVKPPSEPVPQSHPVINQQYKNPEATPMQQQNNNLNAMTAPTQPSVVPRQQQQVFTYVTESNEQQIYQQPTDQQNDVNSQVWASQPLQVSESELPATQKTLNNNNIEPIYPVDTSNNQKFNYNNLQKRNEYNTFGQPVQIVPGQPSAPKSRNDQMKYSNVKSTMSKTSLFGNGNVEKRVSKSQLQHIYNQYKGSQSFTHQNINSPVQAPTHSDRKLNIAQPNINAQQRILVEKLAGDSTAHSMSNNKQIVGKEQIVSQMGDVPCNNSHGDAEQNLETVPPARHAKLRNGLQDIMYTSYPSSAAWSFHGAISNRPVTVGGYRYRASK